jgi:ribosome-interacting GTPase 1
MTIEEKRERINALHDELKKMPSHPNTQLRRTQIMAELSRIGAQAATDPRNSRERARLGVK